MRGWSLRGGCLLVTLRFTSGAVAKTIQVTPTDTATVNMAKIEGAGPGDEVVVAPGTYAFRLYLTAKGTAGSPVTIRAQDPTQRPVWDLSGKAIASWPGTYSGGDNGRAIWQITGSHYRVSGIVLRGGSDGVGDGGGVRLKLSQNVTLHHCLFEFNDNGLQGAGDDTTVEFCEFDSNGLPGSNEGSHNLYIHGGTITVRYCYIHDARRSQNFHIRANQSVFEYNWIARAKSYMGDMMPCTMGTCQAEQKMLGIADLPDKEYYRDEIVTLAWRPRSSVLDIGAFESTTAGAATGPYGPVGPAPDAGADLGPKPDSKTVTDGAAPASDMPGGGDAASRPDDSGCGCVVASRAEPAAGPMLLLALGLLALPRRRRWRRRPKRKPFGSALALAVLLASCPGNESGSPDTTVADSSCSELGAPDSRADSKTGDAPAADGAPADAQLPPDALTPDQGTLVGLPYPTRSPYRVKGLQPDFWSNRNEVAGNNAGGVAVNLVWASWEPAVKQPPCSSATEQELDGRCFKIDAQVEAEIKAYTALGVVVTGVLYGVPAWARTGKTCSPITAGFEIFCTPNDAKDYGRFARMIAARYDGLKGHGRVADFVIHNEVNANDWFDIGCGQGTPCNTTKWLDEYAASYNAAYDGIAAEQSAAKVLVSLEHHFGTSFDAPSAQHPLLSGMTFLTGFASRAAPRAWRVAFHSYPPDLTKPQFSAEDFPKVTFGNLGLLVGWLRQTFPAVPSAWEVQLTENGINSIAPSSPQQQSSVLCDAFRNVLGTPGIESFIYHRMLDHPVEVAQGIALGLRNADLSAKPAWATWALANRIDLNPPQLSCGFEDLPHTRLTRYFSPQRGHWASSRLPPASFTKEQSWRLHRAQAPGTKPLYECAVGQHNRITDAPGCGGGQQLLGPVGHAWTQPTAGAVPLYACTVGAGSDHFVSGQAACEGQGSGQLLGHALP